MVTTGSTKRSDIDVTDRQKSADKHWIDTELKVCESIQAMVSPYALVQVNSMFVSGNMCLARMTCQ